MSKEQETIDIATTFVLNKETKTLTRMMELEKKLMGLPGVDPIQVCRVQKVIDRELKRLDTKHAYDEEEYLIGCIENKK